MRYERVIKVSVFCPPGDVDRIIEGVLKVTSLKYGQYKGVVWVSGPGVEFFEPVEGSRPTKGETGSRSVVESVRLEFSISQNDDLLEAVLRKGIIPFHSWETPVIRVSEELEYYFQRSEVDSCDAL